MEMFCMYVCYLLVLKIYIYIYIILHALVEIYDIFRIFKIMIIILIVGYMHILRNKTKLDFGSATAIINFRFNRRRI